MKRNDIKRVLVRGVLIPKATQIGALP